MLCGYLRQKCSNITVGELIEILKLCKNQDATVKLFDTNTFFVHFDQDGQFINFSKNMDIKNYGNAGVNDSCENCHRYDPRTKECKCDGKNCLNAESIISTEKLNSIRSREAKAPKETENEAPRTQIVNDKYDLSNYGINGAVTSNQYDTPRGSSTPINQVAVEPEKTVKTKPIQDAVDEAIIRTLNKMINGITKGE